MNGFPGYTVERRPDFFVKDWPIVKHSIDQFLKSLPPGVEPPDGMAKELIFKMTRIICCFSDIIQDDQAEILSLRTIMKAMEKKDGPSV